LNIRKGINNILYNEARKNRTRLMWGVDWRPRYNMSVIFGRYSCKV
jgi:hypothetical protein